MSAGMPSGVSPSIMRDRFHQLRCLGTQPGDKTTCETRSEEPAAVACLARPNRTAVRVLRRRRSVSLNALASNGRSMKKLHVFSLAALLTTGLSSAGLADTPSGEGPAASGTPDTVGTQTGSQQVGTPATGSRPASPAIGIAPGYSYVTPRPGGMIADASDRPVGLARTPQADSGFQNGAPPRDAGETSDTFGP
jgi:hypothetical protein